MSQAAATFERNCLYEAHAAAGWTLAGLWSLAWAIALDFAGGTLLALAVLCGGLALARAHEKAAGRITPNSARSAIATLLVIPLAMAPLRYLVLPFPVTPLVAPLWGAGPGAAAVLAGRQQPTGVRPGLRSETERWVLRTSMNAAVGF
jgi:hypothetical protein